MVQQLIFPTGQVAAASPLTGSELVTLDAGGAVDSFGTTAQIAALAGTATTVTKITALNTVGAGVITAAGIVGKITARGGAQTSTPFTDTTDTAAAIIAALPAGAPNGTSFTYRYENTTNANATLAGGVSVTLGSTIVVPAGQWVEVLVIKATATTVSMTYLIGGPLTPLPAAQTVTNATAGATTAAVGDMTGANFCNLILSAVGAANYATRSAAQMFGDIPNCLIGFQYMVAVRNTNAGQTTITAGANVTLTGTFTIAQNVTRLMSVVFPTATTCTIQSMGILAAGA